MLAGIAAAAAPPRIGGLPGFFIKAAEPRGGYVAYAGGMRLYLDRTGVRLVSAGEPLELNFEGANPGTALEGNGAEAERINIFHGSAEAWRTGLTAFSSVRYRGLYPGIDLAYRFQGNRLKSEFIVAAGANPSLIRLRYSGARRIAVGPAGDLTVAAPGGELREEAPYIYQQAGAIRKTVSGRYRVQGSTVAFEIGQYDRTRPLVIDPTISFSTYLGGSGFDSATALAVDAGGNVYVAGWTESYDLPVSGALQSATGGGVDAFVAKLDPTGTRVLYCTYLGGSGEDRATGIAVDPAGNVYVAGWTNSTNFPVTTGVVQSRAGGGRDAFVAKIDGSGSRLVYSTFLGGGGQDVATGLAIDASGNAYISGNTTSTSFPVYHAAQSTNRGQQDAFVAALNATGSALLFSTYLGGMGNDTANAIALDGAGGVYVAGDTTSPNFPTLNAFQPAPGGGQDAFVTKLNSATGALVYSTYLGGSGGIAGLPESAASIAVDSSGSAYVAGVTSSPNFPVAGAFQSNLHGLTDAFLVKLTPVGNALAFGTYLGGSSMDFATAVRVDSTGKACVAGYTGSTDFPVASPTQQANAGGYDAFVSCFTTAGNSLEFSSYLGGAAGDAAYAIAMTGTSVYLAGQTTSSDFPLRNPVQTFNGGGYGPFVAQLQTLTVHPPSLISVTPTSGTGASQTFTFELADPNADIAAFQVLVNGTFSDYRACHVLYSAVSNSLQLLNDAGTTYSASITPGTAAILENSQCALNGAQSSVSGLGTTRLTLRLALTFTQSFTGTKWLPVYISDLTGQNSGWLTPASWTVVAASHKPSVTSVTPTSGSGIAQTFTFQFTDSGADIAYVQILINSSFSDYHACHILFAAATSSVSLLNDQGTSYSAPITLGSTGMLQNSQCQITGAASSVIGTGSTNITLRLALTFNSSFAGQKWLPVYVSDTSGQDSGWVTPASWTVAAVSHKPMVNSLTPTSGTGMNQTFVLQLSDAGADILAAQLLINGLFSDYHACHILYRADSNSLYLLSDDGTIYSAPLEPGSIGRLQNGQCTIDGPSSSVTGLGSTTLTLRVALTFNSSFAGTKWLPVYVSDAAGDNSGWITPASWTVP